MNTKSLLLALIAGTMILPGCGDMKSDPTGDYPELKDSVPPHQSAYQTDIYIKDAFIVTPVDELIFTEGKPGIFKIRALVTQGVRYSLTAHGLPAGAEFTKSPDPREPNIWLLKWTPKYNYIGSDEASVRQKFQIELVVQEVTDLRAQKIVDQLAKVKEMRFEVIPAGEQPTIVAIRGLPEEIEQGKIMPFTVEVRDPTSDEANTPDVQVFYDRYGNTQETYEANGLTFVTVPTKAPAPKRLDNGNWQFVYSFDTRDRIPPQLDKNNRIICDAKTLNVRFGIKAFNSRMRPSPKEDVRVKIRYDIDTDAASCKPQTGVQAGETK